jgi:hypothetical protein
MDKDIIRFKDSDIRNGSCKQGTLNASFRDICDVLGYPDNVGGDKVQCEWNFYTKNGVVMSIYDYKDERNPFDIDVWSVGGFDKNRNDIIDFMAKNFLSNVYVPAC